MAALSIRGGNVGVVWCQGGLRRPKRTFVALVVLLLGLCWALKLAGGEPGNKTGSIPGYEPATPTHNVMARVNGDMITREMLGQECIRHYGKEVLEILLNRHLIAAECERRGIAITKKEVDEEVDRLAQKFSLGKDQWFQMLKQERGINPLQYASDILWPSLALRKISGEKLKPTNEEMLREYESLYGPSVRARIIVTAKQAKAQEAWTKAQAHPDDFPNLAKQYSEDPSASAKGLIQPIRKHMGYKEIEQVAFEMQDGQVSGVIQIGQQFAIVKREQLLPAYDVKLEGKVRDRLEELIRDRKLRSVAHEVFGQLKDAAHIQIVWNNPALQQQMPGVAAVINGRTLSMTDLATACMDRHGDVVLEGTIHRKLIEQELKRAQTTVTDLDLDQEIQRVAAQTLPLRPDHTADVDGFLKVVTKQQGVSLEIYRYDTVWPTVALRKMVLARNKVQVTEEDLHKGFEANYGPKVQCRAIVLDNQRVAQRVWSLAKQRPDPDSFGELAERYSCDPSSAALQGEMPPIRRNGGDPDLEREAFALRKGEISGIIQIGTKHVILFCEGQTTPIDVDFAAVRKLIADDIYEKKVQLAMGELFDNLKDQARIDNFLAGTNHATKNPPAEIRLPPGMPILRAKSAPGS
jgi:parvulin-like peptidyl-prolyl isomerase